MLDLIRHRAQSWGVKIIFGIIILVFVFWGVGSVNQNSPNVAALVNEQPISMVDFYNAVKMQEEQIRMSNPGVSAEELAALQLPQRVMNDLVARLAFKLDAQRLGLSVTTEQLQSVILQHPLFHVEGRFNRERYTQVMGGDTVRAEREMADGILQDKLRGFVAMAVDVTPDEAWRAYSFQAEQRAASYVLFATDDYMDAVTPTDEALQSFYNGNAQRFSHPDRTAVSYIKVRPADLANPDEVPQEEVDAMLAMGPSRFRLSQVAYILPEAADDAEKETARAFLQGMVEEIRAGKDFSTALAEAAQRDPAIQGGDAGWVTRSQVTPEWEERILGLKTGDLTEPMEAPVGYVFFRLEETEPNQDLPEDLIRADIRRALAEERALLGFRETQDAIIEAMDLGKSLEDIAAMLNVRVLDLPLQARYGIPGVLGLTRGVPATVFDAAEGTLIHNILETEDGFVVARIAMQQPAGPIPFADVRAEIVEEVKRIEASRLAEQAANEALPGFQGDKTPTEFEDRVMLSAPLMRGGSVEDFGFAPALATALFDTAPGSWIPRTFAVPKGVVIAKTYEVIPVSEDQWEEDKEGIIQAMVQAKQSQLFSIYLEALDKATTVTVPDPRIYDMF